MTGKNYREDILAQPAALLDLADELERERGLGGLAARLAGGGFDRIVLSGMGASFHALYPAFLELAAAAWPVSWVECSELLFGLRGLLGPRSLLVLASQSGESAEVTSLLDALSTGPGRPFVLGMTNDTASRLARGSDLLLPMRAGAEYSVSTMTFMNSIVLGLDAARALCGGGRPSLAADCRTAARGLEAWFRGSEEKVASLKAVVGLPRLLFFVGRGYSLAAVLNAALITKEAAKCAAQGSTSAAFRHGPFELVSPDCTVLVFAGGGPERLLNIRLAADVIRAGGRAFLLDSRGEEGIPLIEIGSGPALFRPLFETAAIELLTLALADLNGFVAGEFRHTGKVTRLL